MLRAHEWRPRAWFAGVTFPGTLVVVRTPRPWIWRVTTSITTCRGRSLNRHTSTRTFIKTVSSVTSETIRVRESATHGHAPRTAGDVCDDISAKMTRMQWRWSVRVVLRPAVRWRRLGRWRFPQLHIGRLFQLLALR